jgi:hypothetical protein
MDERAEKVVTGCLPGKLFLLADKHSIDDWNELRATGRFRSGIKLNESMDSKLEPLEVR